MGDLLNTLGGAAIFVGVTLGLFIGANWLCNFAPARWERRLRPIIFLAPAMIFLSFTLIVPTIRTIYLSFRKERGGEPAGLQNYRDVFTDDRIFNLDNLGSTLTSRWFLLGMIMLVFGIGVAILRSVPTKRELDMSAPLPFVSVSTAAAFVLLALVGSLRAMIWNNLFWAIFVTGLATVFGLAIAVLADRAKGESLAKSLIFMPMAISFVGASVIWRFVYAFTPGDEQFGLLNAAWVGLGGEPESWIQQEPWNTMLLITIMIWIQTGFAMVVLSAAIKGVPSELLEAARVDGASEVQVFWRVTVPQIRSTIAVVVTTLIITVLKVYDIVKVMTNGEFGTNVFANEMFDQAFINRDYGIGSALAVLIFVSVVPLMVINMRRVRRAEA